MKSRVVIITIAILVVASFSANTMSYATETNQLDSVVNNTESVIPATMLPETEIEYDSNNNMVLTKKGIEIPALKTTDTFSKSENKINISPEINYPEDELRILKEALITQKSNTKVVSTTMLPSPVPGLKVVYDGMGLPNKYYLNGVPFYPSENASTITTVSTRAAWTPPSNGTYYYGDCWIKISTSSNMGQGYVTYFTDSTGCHGDNLNDLDSTVDICATKMQYDRPPRAQEIAVRKLDSNWNDTTTRVYVYKYDIGSLPNAVVDIRKPMMEELSGPEGSSSFGRFNGRYYYSK